MRNESDVESETEPVGTNEANLEAKRMPSDDKDLDYTFARVPKEAFKNFGAMFVIMMGFTFFSGSMWTGVTLANGLDWNGFLLSVLLGGIILSVYTGTLGYIGSDTRLSFHLLCHYAFGRKGSYLPSLMIAATQIGWFGVGAAMFAIPAAHQLAAVTGLSETVLTVIFVLICGSCMTASAYHGIKGIEIVSWISCPLIAILGIASMTMAAQSYDGGFVAMFGQSAGSLSLVSGIGLVVGSFVSGGTATANFTRFAKNNRSSVISTVCAFLIGNTLMFMFGGVAGAATGQNDIFYVMIAQGTFMGIAAFLVLGANIWTTNDSALYTGALGLSNITKKSKHAMVLVSGIVGTVLAIWLYDNFTSYLTILNASLPCIGAIIAVDFFRDRERYHRPLEEERSINWTAIIAMVAGFLVGNLTSGTFIPGFTWGIAALNNMAVAAIVYLVLDKVLAKKPTEPLEVAA